MFQVDEFLELTVAGATNTQASVLLLRPSVRNFFEQALEDLEMGRESWRVLTLLSSAALAIAALYIW